MDLQAVAAALAVADALDKIPAQLHVLLLPELDLPQVLLLQVLLLLLQELESAATFRVATVRVAAAPGLPVRGIYLACKLIVIPYRVLPGP